MSIQSMQLVDLRPPAHSPRSVIPDFCQFTEIPGIAVCGGGAPLTWSDGHDKRVCSRWLACRPGNQR